MIDSAGYEYYLRQKISLENRLSEIGIICISAEIESQMHFVENRLLAKIKQAHDHAMQEMVALRTVLTESAKEP